MPKCSPVNGGCWFCGTDDPVDLGWWFCCEFDTNVHVQCVIDADKRIQQGEILEFITEDEIIVNEFRNLLDGIYASQNPAPEPENDCGC